MRYADLYTDGFSDRYEPDDITIEAYADDAGVLHAEAECRILCASSGFVQVICGPFTALHPRSAVCAECVPDLRPLCSGYTLAVMLRRTDLGATLEAARRDAAARRPFVAPSLRAWIPDQVVQSNPSPPQRWALVVTDRYEDYGSHLGAPRATVLADAPVRVDTQDLTLAALPARLVETAADTGFTVLHPTPGVPATVELLHTVIALSGIDDDADDLTEENLHTAELIVGDCEAR